MKLQAAFGIFVGVAMGQVTTYTYLGNTFSQVSGVITNSNRLVVSLTFASPLPKSAEITRPFGGKSGCSVVSGPVSSFCYIAPQAWTFSNGVITLSNSSFPPVPTGGLCPSTCEQLENVDLYTDSAGNIVRWSLSASIINQYGGGDASFSTCFQDGCDTGSPIDAANIVFGAAQIGSPGLGSGSTYTAGTWTTQVPTITSVQNAEGGSAVIAPNTWVAIKGSALAPAGDSRIWQASDFVKNRMPVQLDGVGVSMNGQSAYVYYISPTQLNVLTPPDLGLGPVQVKVSILGVTSSVFTAQAQQYSPSLFVFGAGPYVVGTHLNGGDIGPVNLYPGLTTPARPGETIVLYATGFGPVSSSVIAGSDVQSGSLPTLPVVRIGTTPASVQFAGLVSPGLYQFNVVVPASTPDGDETITAEYNGLSTQAGVLLTVKS
jgi:uncharacterized protein (TIGR03437 family)